MINTLQTRRRWPHSGDGNLEGANMLALQTRQQLSIQADVLACVGRRTKAVLASVSG